MSVVEPGMRFGFLTVLRRGKTRYWVVKCYCGVIKEVQHGQLRTKERPIKSCGCKRIELLRKARTVHGDSIKGCPGFKTYIAWQSMLWRCKNKNRSDYKSYGGRGITVCERWESYPHFLADMGRAPENKSVGRIDNEGMYEPSNCRWETTTQQARNKRTNHVVEFRGVSKTITEWALETGIEKSKLRGRIVAGWPIEKALTP